jgi:hypothetical protein
VCAIALHRPQPDALGESPRDAASPAAHQPRGKLQLVTARTPSPGASGTPWRRPAGPQGTGR